MKKRFLIPLFVPLMALSACSQEMVEVKPTTSDSDVVVELAPVSLKVGETQEVEASVSGPKANYDVTWQCSDTDGSIVSIAASSGESVFITGVSTGTATLVAMVGSVASAGCLVTVSRNGDSSITVTDLTVSETSKSLVYQGQDIVFELTATVSTSIPTHVTVAWSSTNEQIASITPKENNKVDVKVKSVGECDIVARAGNKSSRCRLSVTAPDVSGISISLDKNTNTIEAGKTFDILATVEGEDVSDINWQTNAPAVASVATSGNNKCATVTALKAGTATISATITKGQYTKSATCSVTVTAKHEASDYEKQIAAWSKPGHLYVHYKRTTDSDYSKWALWIWQNFPKSLAGSLWGADKDRYNDGLLKGIEPTTFGWMTKGDILEGGTTDPYSDETGQIIDVDLTKEDLVDGKAGLPSPLVSVWEGDKFAATELGFLIVDQDKMDGSDMWVSDGSANTYIEGLGEMMPKGKQDYLHIYCVEGSVGDFSYSQGVEVEPNPTLTDESGNYRSTDDQTLLNKDEYKNGVSTSETFLTDEPGVGYQIFVPSFADSDGDGFGDIRGIINKLDYIKNDVGADVLWLTPIQKSDSYHGYDVTDYYKIDPKFGTLDDYQELIYRAHKKGMKVLMDMVINHTSKNNVLFKKSERAAVENGINYRDMYLWKYKDDNVLVWDNTGDSKTVTLNNYVSKKVTDEACKDQWYRDGTSNYYYFGKFGSGMAELNYNCQATRDYMTDMCKYWLSFGLDGFRLDAIKHIYLLGELDPNLKSAISGHTFTFDVGTKHYYNEETFGYVDVPNDYSYDLQLNVLFWKQFAGKIKSSYPNCFLVGENFDGWNERMAPFYKAMDSQFDFPNYYALNEKEPSALADFTKTTNGIYKSYRSDMINGAYTSNHDVARLINHAAIHHQDVKTKYDGGDASHKTEVIPGPSGNSAYAINMAKYYAAVTILTPGLSWIYYGDEIGMSGNEKDAVKDSNGKVYNDHGNNVDRWYRQPMRWAKTKGEKGVVNYTFGGIEVLWDNYNQTLPTTDEQKANTGSLLNYFKALCAVKNDPQYPTYGTVTAGGAEAGCYMIKVEEGNRKVAVFINREDTDANISWIGVSYLAGSTGATTNKIPAHGWMVLKMGA